MNAEELLAQALTHVQSQSIRAWATSDANRALWLKIASTALEKNPKTDPLNFATYITITAMG